MDVGQVYGSQFKCSSHDTCGSVLCNRNHNKERFGRNQLECALDGGRRFALGVALQETGLAQHMIEAIPFNTWPPILMIVGSGLICYAMANFISHTATAALLVPILAIAGVSMRENLLPLGVWKRCLSVLP